MVVAFFSGRVQSGPASSFCFESFAKTLGRIVAIRFVLVYVAVRLFIEPEKPQKFDDAALVVFFSRHLLELASVRPDVRKR
jgi:hypothetical protein